MTGLDVSGDASAAQAYPVMVVKIDNTGSSAPQVGLDSADLVVEELVEGGSTRLAAFFYSDIPDEVGPVRSMRASDIGIVSPVDATMVTSGAASVTIDRIEDAGIDYFAEGDDGLYRDDSRSAPYNLMADLVETTEAAERGGGPTRRLPAVGHRGGAARGAAGEDDRGDLLGRAHHQLALRRRRLRQRQQLRRPGGAVPGRHDPGAARGGRRRRLHRPGRQPRARDHAGGHRARRCSSTAAGSCAAPGARPDLDSPIELSTKAGELVVPAGHTWIELIPVETGDVTFTKK